MAISHFLLFRLVFDDEFEERFTGYQNRIKQQLVNGNQEFVSSMRGIIELDPEAVEVGGFGDQWRQGLGIIEEMKEERQELQGRINIVYYVLILSVLVSSIVFWIPNEVALPFGYTFYITSVSWGLLLLALLLIFYLLLQHYLMERRFSDPKFLEKREGGQRISPR
jgi:hypothetical protein